MEKGSERVIKILYSSAPEDKSMLENLDKHLVNLKRNSFISTWHHDELQPGIERIVEVEKHFKAADIVILLISSSFFNSDYCHDVEMKKALEKQKNKEAIIIPILLSPCDWENTQIGKLEILPTAKMPIVLWNNREQAFWDVAKNIRQKVEALLKSRVKVWKVDGYMAYRKSDYIEVLAIYDQIIKIEPNDIEAWYMKGISLIHLKRYEEALVIYKEATKVNPNNAMIYYGQGFALWNLERLEEAEKAYKRARELDFPNSTWREMLHSA